MIAPIKGKSSASSSSSSNSPTCMVPGCDRPAKLRGVCQSCYQNAAKLIQRGGTTWEELQKFGLVRPRHSGSGLRAALYRALDEARSKANGGKKSAKASGKKGKSHGSVR